MVRKRWGQGLKKTGLSVLEEKKADGEKKKGAKGGGERVGL